jgi:hypothetical protein
MRLKAIPVEKMQSEFPKTFSYLKRFENMLKKRAAFKRYFREEAPFYSIFDIGDYTFSKYKVVWPWISKRVSAAVIGSLNGKVIIPEHNTSFVSFDSKLEAHYFCASFNSAPCEVAIISSYGGGGGGIAAPSVLERVHIQKFSEKKNIHLKLAELSEAAHKAATAGDTAEVERIEEEVDRWAAKLWGLSEEELAEIKRSLEEA